MSEPETAEAPQLITLEEPSPVVFTIRVREDGTATAEYAGHVWDARAYSIAVQTPECRELQIHHPRDFRPTPPKESWQNFGNDTHKAFGWMVKDKERSG
jgi:hypothetical protein